MTHDMERLRKKSNQTATVLGLPGRHNGEWDAYRHAFTAGEMSIKHDPRLVAFAGYLNELDHDQKSVQGLVKPNKPGERDMDLLNNRIGIELAAGAKGEAEVSDRILRALHNGELRTIPDPKQRYRPFDGRYPAERGSRRGRGVSESPRSRPGPSAGQKRSQPSSARDAEIAAIEQKMRKDRPGYFADANMQKRYRALLADKLAE